MASEPVRAGADWLALREPADAAARSRALVDALRPQLPTGAAGIHDLGSGTGSMARWLAPCSPARSAGCCTTGTPTCSAGWRRTRRRRTPTAARATWRPAGATSPGSTRPCSVTPT